MESFMKSKLLLLSLGFVACLNGSYSMRQDLPTKELFDAIENANIETVKSLLEKRIDPNTQYQGKSALTKAITLSDHNAKAIVELLLQHGADPDHVDASGMTPLVVAKYVNNPDIVLLLLQYGARVTAAKELKEEKKHKIKCPYEKGVKRLEKEFYMVPAQEEGRIEVEYPISAWQRFKNWLY